MQTNNKVALIFLKEGKRAQCLRPLPMVALRVDISILAKNCRGN